MGNKTSASRKSENAVERRLLAPERFQGTCNITEQRRRDHRTADKRQVVADERIQQCQDSFWEWAGTRHARAKERIEQQDDTIQDLRKRIQAAERSLVLANERIQQQALVTERIQQQDASIKQLNQQLQWTDMRHTRAKERIEEQDNIIQDLRKRIKAAERSQVLANERIQQQALVTERIQQQDAIIDQLNQKIRTAVKDKLVLNQEIDKQVTVIQQLRQTLRTAVKDKLVLNQEIDTQGTIIQQLRQTIRTQEVARQTEKCAQATQTNKNDVYVGNHHAVQHRTPSMYSAQYYHHVIDTWHYIFIERSVHAEPMGKPNNARIQMFTASRRTWSSDPRRIIQPMLPRLQPGEKIYFHGSSDGHVKSIVENGIDVSKSTRATDFSCGGFYVTKNFGKAVEWSKRRAKWDRGRPAVIAFKISRSLRKEQPHLALKVDSSTNRKWWECVVSHFRHLEMSPDVHKVLADVKFIKGPVANNKYVSFDENPRPFDFTQLCIRDEEYARRFGSLHNIVFVIFGVNK
ncbi:hypothetical protein BsWGS_17082 [Bradybaena similaris]